MTRTMLFVYAIGVPVTYAAVQMFTRRFPTPGFSKSEERMGSAFLAVLWPFVVVALLSTILPQIGTLVRDVVGLWTIEDENDTREFVREKINQRMADEECSFEHAASDLIRHSWETLIAERMNRLFFGVLIGSIAAWVLAWVYL